MGIYDRDYVRERPAAGYGGYRGGLGRGGGIPSAGTWSVNTWIIVLCIGIFVIDGFTPRQWVLVGVDWAPAVPVTLREIDRFDYAPPSADPGNLPHGITRQPVRDPASNTAVGQAFYTSMGLLENWLHFSTARGFLGFQFWRFVGFQFLHANLTHILFNMIGLYFFGPMVERYLGSKRYLAFYLLAGICGAAMYLILNLGGYVAMLMGGETVRIPGLLFNDTHTPLVGASAGVFGVLMAGAYIAPNAVVLLFFILPMPLRTLAYALVIMAFVTVILSGVNAGGEAGHIGGAIAGFYFIRHPRHLHNFFDVLGWLDPTSHHYRGDARGKAVSKAAGPRSTRSRGGASQAEVDRILDKVHAEGLASLSEKEKRILREASERGG